MTSSPSSNASNRRPFRASKHHPNVYIPPEILDEAAGDPDLLDELLNRGTSRLFHFERLFRKCALYYERMAAVPKKIRIFWRAFLKVMSSRSEFMHFARSLWKAIVRLPIVTFYTYLYRTSKTHFFTNLFIGYALPMILEAMPWYFSRRKIGRELRDARNKIHNRMISGNSFHMPLGKKYIGMALLYSFLETLDRHIKTRSSMMDKFLIKRLVLERLLYSELWAVEGLNSRELEYRIMSDISTTLHFFTFTIPSIGSNIFAIVTEARDLFIRRGQIDWLAVTRPFASMLIWKIVDWLRREVVGHNLQHKFALSSPEVQSLFANVLDGLTDVQLNNLQQPQMDYYDDIVSREFNFLESIRFFAMRIYNGFTNRGVFDFLSDVFVADVVMSRKGMSYEQYRKIQIDINHLYNLVRRTGTYLRSAKRVVQRQKRVVELMSLPNFQDEDKWLPVAVESFDHLVMRDVFFSYSGVPPYALRLEGEIRFDANQIYGIIGQNRSGKSTMVNIICKLYAPLSGSIEINGISYDQVQRNSLRSIISYVSQKPFIFAGTIRDNILIGNPDATEQELMEAASLAGVFSFDEVLDLTTPPQLAQVVPMPLSTMVKSMPVRQKHSISHTARTKPIGVTLTPRSDGTVNVQLIARDTETNRIRMRADSVGLVQYGTAPDHPIAVRISPNKENDNMRQEITVSLALRGKRERKTREISLAKKRQVLDMVTSPRGANLSGGFAQSVALARIFLRKKSKIVILDESMSAMDPIKKRNIIYPGLLRFVKKHGMTLIMISHDMSCLDMVDNVIMLERGKLVCQGTHEQLLEVKDQKYLQMLGYGKISRL